MLLTIFERTVMFMRDRAKCKLRGGRSRKTTSVEKVSSPTISIHRTAGDPFLVCRARPLSGNIPSRSRLFVRR
jgi:hypothetical protein